jgi:hypothetical protein
MQSKRQIQHLIPDDDALICSLPYFMLETAATTEIYFSLWLYRYSSVNCKYSQLSIFVFSLFFLIDRLVTMMPAGGWLMWGRQSMGEAE